MPGEERCAGKTRDGLPCRLRYGHPSAVACQADPRVSAERGIRDLLALVDDDPGRDGLRDTPARVVRAFVEMTEGYRQDPREILARTFADIPYDGMVMLDGIAFTSMCEHHLLAFTGTARVAYIPRAGQPVVGLSKLARLVLCFARRLQVQERMTVQIADAIRDVLDPLGVGVVLRARHSCMACRGVRVSAEMTTSVLYGALRDEQAARAEFMGL